MCVLLDNSRVTSENESIVGTTTMAFITNMHFLYWWVIVAFMVTLSNAFVPSTTCIVASHNDYDAEVAHGMNRRRVVLHEKKISRFQQKLEKMRQEMGLPDNILDAAKDSDKFASMKEDNEKRAKDEAEREEKKRNRKPFVPIEEWDRMEKEKEKNKGISWEDQVRFDGMRHGNQDRQHDILMRNLHK